MDWNHDGNQFELPPRLQILRRHNVDQVGWNFFRRGQQEQKLLMADENESFVDQKSVDNVHGLFKRVAP